MAAAGEVWGKSGGEETSEAVTILAPKRAKGKRKQRDSADQSNAARVDAKKSNAVARHVLRDKVRDDVERDKDSERDSHRHKCVQDTGGDDEAPGVSNSFKSLGLNTWLSSVCISLGMKRPTPVQLACIPQILEGRDVVACAETGGGKTASFLLPAIQSLAKERFGVFALVLVPARELAFQAAEQLRALGGSVLGLKDLVCVGGLSVAEQANVLSQKPHFVFATPGRLKDILTHDSSCSACFKRLRMFIIDEADRLLDPTFEEDLSVIAGFLPPKRQTLLFSATITQSIETLQKVVMKDAFRYSQYEALRAVEKIKDEYIFVPEKVKEVYLYHLLTCFEEMKVRSAIIFVGTCEGCHTLAYLLDELDISAVALHSKQKQKQRLASLSRFKSGVVPVLVATDVASRGLDIPTVDLVVNFDLPKVAREYIHRIGRTGRAGRRGQAISFVTQYSVEVFQKIEELIQKKLSQFETNEKKVLKLITRVFAAKKAVRLRMEEEDEDKD